MAEKIRRFKNLGPLHDLLIEACPPDEKGAKSTNNLAKLLKMSAWGVHLWIKRGRIPPGKAKMIVEIANNPEITLDRFSPWIYG